MCKVSGTILGGLEIIVNQSVFFHRDPEKIFQVDNANPIV